MSGGSQYVADKLDDPVITAELCSVKRFRFKDINFCMNIFDGMWSNR